MKQIDPTTAARARTPILARLIHSCGAGVRALMATGMALALALLVLRALAMETLTIPVSHPTGRTEHDTFLASETEVTSSNGRLGASHAAPVGAGLVAPTAQVSVLKAVRTGTGDDSLVFNGDWITYTIIISNDAQISDVVIRDSLLDKNDLPILENVKCRDCYRQIAVVSMPEPLGGVVEITFTQGVSWRIASLVPGVTQREFWGRVTGQSDGTILTNRALVQYDTNEVATSNIVKTPVRVRVETPGGASVSAAPTWLSADMGGTISMDWGDYDADGDLDLVLGSSLGATIYENVAGQLLELRGDHADSSRPAYGVRWADFNNDRLLELIVVGDSDDGTAATAGINYVYRWDGEDYWQEAHMFTSDFQLVRVAPGDYNGDGHIDLVGSTNGINPACPVWLYVNSGKEWDLFTDRGRCVSMAATASIGPGDFDNDGDLDLALGQFPAGVRLFENVRNGDVLTDTDLFTNGVRLFSDTLRVDDSLSFLPYDFAWGDYDGDGDLNLAAAYPLERRVRIYSKPTEGEFDPSTPWSFKEIRSEAFMTPLSIGWGDFNGDGRLDLVTAGSPPKVYQYDEMTREFSLIRPLSPAPLSGQIWSIPAADYDGDGDLDLTLSNLKGASLLFTTFAPYLKPTIDGIGSLRAGSVAWGDVSGDGYLDLLFGAGKEQVESRLYVNDRNGDFREDASYTPGGLGPHSVAFGDLDGDFDLDLAFGTNGINEIYLSGSTEPPWESPAALQSHSVALGDADDDGDLDLLVGNDGSNMLFINKAGEAVTFVPVWSSTAQADTRAVAWGDFNGDRYLDFAAGNYGEPTRVYRNNRDNSFTPVWTSLAVSHTTSVAWGDWDGDGDPELAVGNDGEANLIYENLGETLSQEPVWTSWPVISNTRSLTWGDWDNDGDPDLAVGNYGQPDQVYANLSTPGAPQLAWLWTSEERYKTTGVAWGDRDRDGDLDLAISQDGLDQNGVYENTYVMPSHLTDRIDETMPLPNNPSYLSIERPGHTQDAYFLSSAELLSGPTDGVVEIEYSLFDPDPAGTRDEGLVAPSQAGDEILDTFFEFSLDGGGTWDTATPSDPPPSLTLQTTREGNRTTFFWDAVADEAISDDARFRITIVQGNRNRPFQRASISAVSPPFRVRGLTCYWPEGPSITFTPPEPEFNSPVTFWGGLEAGSGVLTFTWDFGDGSPVAYGQRVQHTFSIPGTYDLRLTVTSEPCPAVKQVFASTTITIPGHNVYLPLILKTASGVAITGTSAVPGAQHRLAPQTPLPVGGLWGYADPQSKATYLGWRSDSVKRVNNGYRIYRRAATDSAPFVLIATVPADGSTYTDETAYCGQSYYVTAYNGLGESPVSPASYFSPPCQR